MKIFSVMLIAIMSYSVGFLQPDEAFKPEISVSNKTTAVVEIVLGEQIYLYANKLKIEDADVHDGIDMSDVKITTSTADHEGEKVYEISPVAHINLSKSTEVKGEQNLKIKVLYQGCSSAGLCYEPQESILELVVNADDLPIKSATLKADAITFETPVPDQESSSETDQIANVISGGSLWFIILSFFGFGLLLALTPCVFPMIPIISSVIVSQGEGLGTKKAFWLSLVYVLSMAVAYTIAGILAGLFGANLQAAFQTPWIITLFALIFLVLSLAMFDVYEIQVPNFIQSRVSQLSGAKSGIIGVAIMGFLSALIVGPCVAAPLAGALIYIGQTGDALLGGVALFALSIGMGVPLLVVGTTAGKFMPRPGVWMDTIKSIFGIMLIGIAIWMISRILEENITLMLWGALALFVAINMGALEPLEDKGSWTAQANLKALGVLILLYALSLLIGGMAGAKNPLHPLEPFVGVKANISSNATSTHKMFETITTIEELDAILADNNGEKVLVDFYADWCSACKELDEKTFSDEGVKTAMDAYVLVRVDVTANDEAAKAITKKYAIFGPPAILFFDEKGQHINEKMVVGFKESTQFLDHLKGIQ